MSVVRISHPTSIVKGKIRLDGSKSISNRALIIKALCKEDFPIHHISSSDDTSTMKDLLNNGKDIFDVHHAGTTFRFLTSFLAVSPRRQFLTGSSRMKERPIGPLVDALRDLGADISYSEKEGYPPLNIGPFDKKNYISKIKVKADISSQYITSLLLIAPSLPNGLELSLEGELVSEPYLNMTLTTLSEFGIEYKKGNGTISILPQEYSAKEYTVEADWSACSYYYSIAALSKECNIQLEGLFSESIQGDAKIKDIAELYGVKSEFDKDGVLHITKNGIHNDEVYYDFINQPDLAQTVAVMSAGKGIPADFTGLKTLRIKETDRISAIQKELQKVSSDMPLGRNENEQEHYVIRDKAEFSSVPRFSTYKDHRMAMAFAPLSLLHEIEMENPDVVSKSYPAFWEDLKTLGFKIENIHE
ncbi:MAG: 3-phosphoshikimate 1-carboxyvinyltransferase [Saprospiraceae bacterium]|nr:3-phosphoshikimate 1-carboxyvinyltransferase [Saprospiraceae bacterium]